MINNFLSPFVRVFFKFRLGMGKGEVPDITVEMVVGWGMPDTIEIDFNKQKK